MQILLKNSAITEHFNGGFNSEHNGGGAIMGADPETSALNNYLQMWDMENLFVCGANAFPHFGAPNPTTNSGCPNLPRNRRHDQILKRRRRLVGPS